MLSIAVAAISGTIAYLIIGWVTFEFILGKFTEKHMIDLPAFKKSDAESSTVLLIVSCAAYSLLLTILFYVWTGTSTVVEGFIIGATIGGLISVMTSSYWYSNSHLFKNYKPVMADVPAAVISVGVMGAVIAWVLGKF